MTTSPEASNFTVVAPHETGGHTVLFAIAGPKEALDDLALIGRVIDKGLKSMRLKHPPRILAISPETNPNPRTFQWDRTHANYSRIM